MPLRHRNLQEGPALFFITTSRFRREKFPDYPHSLPVIEGILFRTARDKSVVIMGYVIMPTHLHLIAGSQNGGGGISRFMHSLKGRIRETLVGKAKFWEDRFDDVHLRSQKHFLSKLNYIHYNPVRAGLVECPQLWEWSSYCDWMGQNRGKGVVLDFNWINAVGSGDPTAQGKTVGSGDPTARGGEGAERRI